MTQWRLPIEGKPSECEQEVVDTIMTTGHMSGMAGMAKPIIVDIDKTAMLGKVFTWQQWLVELMRATRWSVMNCSSNKQICSAKKYVSTMKMQMKTYLVHMECCSRGSGQYVQVARQRSLRAVREV